MAPLAGVWSLSCRDDEDFAVKAIDTQTETCDKSSLNVVRSRQAGQDLPNVFWEERMVREDVTIRK